MRVLLSCTLVVFACCRASADDKIDAKKLVGKWEPKGAAKGASVVIEFHKGGKLTVIAVGDGKEEKSEGTYKIDGDKLSVTFSRGGKEKTSTVTVAKLTDAELVTKDGAKEETFTRIKGK